MDGLPAFLVVGFFIVAFLSLFPFEEAVIGVAGIVVAGVVGAALIALLRRRRSKPVLGPLDAEANPEGPAPVRPK